MKNKETEFNFAANSEYYNYNDACEHEPYDDDEEIDTEQYEEVPSSQHQQRFNINMCNYNYMSAETGYDDPEWLRWKKSL